MSGLLFWLVMIVAGFSFGVWLGYQIGTSPEYTEWDDEYNEDDLDDDE